MDKTEREQAQLDLAQEGMNHGLRIMESDLFCIIIYLALRISHAACISVDRAHYQIFCPIICVFWQG